MAQNDPCKVLPVELYQLASHQNEMASVDPLLCGYQLLLNKFNIPKSGVIHLGGHIGQELPAYAALGFERVVLVEPQEAEYQILQLRIKEYNKTFATLSNFLDEQITRKAHAVQCAISDRSGMTNFYKTKDSLYSSLFKPVPEKKTEYDKIPFYYEMPVVSKTLDELVGGLPNNWGFADFSYLRISCPGAQLLTLKNGENLLNAISMIHIEYNLEPKYESDPTKKDIDKILNKKKFSEILNYSLGNVTGNVIYAKL